MLNLVSVLLKKKTTRYPDTEKVKNHNLYYFYKEGWSVSSFPRSAYIFKFATLVLSN